MSLSKVLAVALCLFSVSSSSPLKGSFAPRQDPSPTTPAPADSTACGDIVVAVNQGYTFFSASWVYECLQSVPFNAAVATRFLDYYNMTLQFQSTLAYLKAPPAGYQRPPFDVNQALEKIKQNATAGVYKNQYEFDAQLQLFVTQMRDTHVTLNAGALSQFSFVSSYGLVSASIDGKQAPEIYLDEDLTRENIFGEYEASPVAQINGVDVVEYLTRFAERNSAGYLEPHADWNAIMDTPPLEIQGYLSTFQSANLYPGDDILGDALNFTFKNGTTLQTNWWAYCIDCEDTGPLTTGGDFYNYFVLGLYPASYQEGHQWWPADPDATNTTNTTSSDNDSNPNDDWLKTLVDSYCAQGSPSAYNWCNSSFGAYPANPSIAQDQLSIFGGGIVTGYILDDISTAVLSIPSFFQTADDVDNFRQSIDDFIGNASQTKATRVVIDLQRNSGGFTYLAYDTFKKFFPNLDPRGASRQRSHQLSNILGKAYTDWWDSPDTDHGANYQWASNEWVATERINAATGQNFSSWAEFYGPEVDNGDTFSRSQIYNLSNADFSYAAFREFVTGYDPTLPLNDTTPKWAPENIVILTDGLCASACTIFVEAMTHQAGVRTITAGGQPKSGPMQTASGSRGAAIYSADALDWDFDEGLGFSVDKHEVAYQLPNRSDTGMWINYAGFTIRNQVRDNEFTPLQFKYQAADCRIYYTLNTVYNMTELWRYAARATWDDASLCVQDSTGYSSARNSTASKPPPAINPKQSSAFSYTPNQSSFFPDNSTFALVSGPQPPNREAAQIMPCPQDPNDCSSGPCVNLQIRCGAQFEYVSACVPKCKSPKNQRTGCTGVDTWCDTDGPLDGPLSSKSNGPQAGTNAGTNAVLYSGHCKTNTPSGPLKCSRTIR